MESTFGIIPRATIIFRRYPTKPSDELHPSDIVRVAPSDKPIQVPAWLKEDDAFKLCVKDGQIILPADPNAAATASQLAQVSHLALAREIESRGFAVQVIDPVTNGVVYESTDHPKPLQAAEAGTLVPAGTPGAAAGLGGQPATPSPADKKAAADQEAKAEAANAANAGSGPADAISVMTTKTGDEKTNRPDAPTTVDAAKDALAGKTPAPVVDDKSKESKKA